VSRSAKCRHPPDQLLNQEIAVPLHPALQPLLDAFAQAPPPPVDPVQRVAALRVGVATFNTVGAGEPEAVHAVDDLEVDGPHGPIPVRRYLPTDEADLPVVVWLHGGGFVCGDVASYDLVARRLAVESGAAVFSVDYRLAPEFPFPIPLDDCHAALAWVVANASELGVDGARVAVAGDSAGGNLSAAVALRARIEGPELRAQALIYPVIDPGCDTKSMVENATGYMLTADSMREMWAFYLGGADPNDAFLAVDKAADLSGLPPALILTAEFDPLRDEGEHYASLLDAADVDTKLVRYDGMIHGFFGMRELVPAANAAMAETAAFLRAQLA
jgi:acetyl esterase